jgi:hypothetical protein
MKCLCQCADTGILFFEVALFASAKRSIRHYFAISGLKKPQEAITSINQQQPGINPQ